MLQFIFYYYSILVQYCQQVASAFKDALQATKMTHLFYLLVPTSGESLHSSPGMTYLMTELSANKHTETEEMFLVCHISSVSAFHTTRTYSE